MAEVAGARDFNVAGDAYDRFMGRFSLPLAPQFADFGGVRPGVRFLDVGCGPGALTGVAVERLGAESVTAVDPSPPFAATCRERNPGVDVRDGAAEALPFGDDEFDVAAAQLVMHFVTDPPRATTEMSRVVRPGGVVAACTWDATGGMDLLEAVRLAGEAVAPGHDEQPRFGTEGELATLFTGAGLTEVEETTLLVTSEYAGFDELAGTLETGVGPAAAFYITLPPDGRATYREALFEAVGSPAGAFTLIGTARAVRGVVPG